MIENIALQSVLELYIKDSPLKEKIGLVLKHLANILPCQAYSVFLFDEYAGNLRFFQGTNIKKNIEIPRLGQDTAIWSMFNSGTPTLLSEKYFKPGLPTTDIFFEDVAQLKSIIANPILDDKKNKIAVLRLINKLNKQGKIQDFQDTDIQVIKSISNVIGSLITMATLRTRFEAFLDSVTHELLAPVSGMKNAGFFMQRVAKKDDFAKDREMRASFDARIEDIIKFSQQAISLIQGLTMYTKSGRMVKTDLILQHSHLYSDVIEKCRGSLMPFLTSRNFKQANIRCINRGNWPLLNIDRKIFRQIFNNMLSNSIKYAHDDPEAFQVNIEVEVLSSGDVNIIVQDYGIGIEKDESERIFEPTVRGKKAQLKVTAGTGIGLTTVRNLLSVHGARIEITSLANPTEFTITIGKSHVIRRQYDHFYRR